MSKSKDDDLKRQAIKDEYLRSLYDSQAESIKQFDTQVLYISSGALLLSITFVGDVIKLDTAIFMWVLITSWISLVVTIILSVLSHLTSYHQHDRAIKKIQNDKEPLNDEFNRNLNRSVAALFLIGIISLIIFAIINISNMNKQKPQVTTQIKISHTDSLVIKPAPVDGTLGSPVPLAPSALLQPKPKR